MAATHATVQMLHKDAHPEQRLIGEPVILPRPTGCLLIATLVQVGLLLCTMYSKLIGTRQRSVPSPWGLQCLQQCCWCRKAGSRAQSLALHCVQSACKGVQLVSGPRGMAVSAAVLVQVERDAMLTSLSYTVYIKFADSAARA